MIYSKRASDQLNPPSLILRLDERRVPGLTGMEMTEDDDINAGEIFEGESWVC